VRYGRFQTIRHCIHLFEAQGEAETARSAWLCTWSDAYPLMGYSQQAPVTHLTSMNLESSTISRLRERFEPIEPSKVSIDSCSSPDALSPVEEVLLKERRSVPVRIVKRLPGRLFLEIRPRREPVDRAYPPQSSPSCSSHGPASHNVVQCSRKE
jgi:hypothetical protein